MKNLLLIIVSIYFILSESISAQGEMDFVNYTGSVSTFGMGEQGAALRNGRDAFTFNPANLSYSSRAGFSFYRNPFQMYYSVPLSNVNLTAKVRGIGSFGIQYLLHDFGEAMVTTPENPDGTGGKVSMYSYSLGLGYSREFSDEFSAGLTIKYAEQKYGSSQSKLLLSFGLNYQPEYLYRKVTLGFSLMNMGTPVEYEIYTGTPWEREKTTEKSAVASQMHLAVNILPFENEYFSTPFQLGLSRRINKIMINEPNRNSSFSSLFENWSDFPSDTKLHLGLAFSWKPLELGKGYYFLQNFYLGNVSSGSKAYSSDYMTHGAEIGIGYSDFSFSAGYSGLWHRVQADRFITPKLPYETFQFSFEWDINKYLSGKSDQSSKPAALNGIIVTAGAGYNFRKGHLLPDDLGKFIDIKSRNSISYSIESAFYFNLRNALVAELSYTSMPIGYIYHPTEKYRWEYNTKYETVGLYSAYRYHPVEAFSELYVQGGAGIIRINPVWNSSPKYLYLTSFNVAAGANLEILNNKIVINPNLNYQLMFVPLAMAKQAPRLGGDNQFKAGVNLGYRFN